VAAGDQQREEWEFGRLRLEERGEQVPFEVMHADRRLGPGIGQRARERRADEQRADQTGAGRIGDRVDRRRRRVGLRERGTHQR